jgi:hypothetical protein
MRKKCAEANLLFMMVVKKLHGRVAVQGLFGRSTGIFRRFSAHDVRMHEYERFRKKRRKKRRQKRRKYPFVKVFCAHT